MNRLSKGTDAKWVLKLKSPPVDGNANANEEVIRVFSRILKLPKCSIILVSGSSKAHKRFEIAAEKEEEMMKLLEDFRLAR